jgi:hypothetical protein
MYDVAFLPILAAGIANVIIGMLWFHPKLFGARWMREVNSTPEMIERGKRTMTRNAVIALLAGMLAAYVMDFFGVAYGVTDIWGAIQLGFWSWLGFTAVPMLGMVLWEQKSLRYYAIVSGGWLVSFVVMSLVLYF